MAIKKICAHCGKEFTAETDRARWCSDACRQAAYRERLQRNQEQVNTKQEE